MRCRCGRGRRRRCGARWLRAGSARAGASTSRAAWRRPGDVAEVEHVEGPLERAQQPLTARIARAGARASCPASTSTSSTRAKTSSVEHGQIRLGQPVERAVGCGVPACPSARARKPGNDGLAAASTSSSTASPGLGRRAAAPPSGGDGRPAAGRRPSTPGPRPGSPDPARRKPRSITASTWPARSHAAGTMADKAEPGRAPRPAPRAADREGLVVAPPPLRRTAPAHRAPTTPRPERDPFGVDRGAQPLVQLAAQARLDQPPVVVHRCAFSRRARSLPPSSVRP